MNSSHHHLTSPARDPTYKSRSKRTRKMNSASRTGTTSLRHSGTAIPNGKIQLRQLSLSSQTLQIPGRPRTPSPRTYKVSSTVIGRGARSVVYLGTCEQTDEKVAIKVVQKKNLNFSSTQALLLEEEILRKVEDVSRGSSSFVRLLAKEETETEIRLVMEHIAGAELFEYCVKHPRGVPERPLQSVMRQIVNAVALLHNNDIVHLDLKLENIMFNEATGRCTILDFGFAKHDKHRDPSSGQMYKISHTTFCGSIHYAAPELICQKPFDGKKADVWSLGVLLYAMATSKFPFDDKQDRRNVIFNKILRGEVTLPASLSPHLVSLIKGMLNRNPVKRWSLEQVLAHPWFAGVRDGEVGHAVRE